MVSELGATVVVEVVDLKGVLAAARVFEELDAAIDVVLDTSTTDEEVCSDGTPPTPAKRSVCAPSLKPYAPLSAIHQPLLLGDEVDSQNGGS